MGPFYISLYPELLCGFFGLATFSQNCDPVPKVVIFFSPWVLMRTAKR